MTQQNRVDPWGVLCAVPARGTLMGNRGILHDDEGRIVRHWASASWLTCLLQFRGRSSPGQFRSGHYSKLFFLDEATAFAAGHRPCAECQKGRYGEFCDAWRRANSDPQKTASFTVKDLDRQLHRERISKEAPKGKQTFEGEVAHLPLGTMVELEDRPHLVAGDSLLLPWTFDGYVAPVPAPTHAVRVLSPPSIVRTFSAGFVPHVHASAGVRPAPHRHDPRNSSCGPYAGGQLSEQRYLEGKKALTGN